MNKMDTINKLLEISSRLEHLEKSAEWITKETVHSDNAISQTGCLICVLVDEVREKVCSLVKKLEKRIEYSEYH